MDNEQKFEDWIKIKKKLDSANNHPRISEGEIWWCGVGKNVGVEINGKNQIFSRPVLVFKKLGPLAFLAIPLTSQAKTGTWFVSFIFRNRHEIAVLSQIRIISVSRLYTRMGEIEESDFEKIKAGFKRLYLE